MLGVLLYMILLFFSLGTVATARLNRKSDAGKAKERWVKYVLYLIIVLSTVCCIWIRLMPYLAIGLLALGGYEIVVAWRASGRSMLFKVVSIVAFGTVAFGFYRFSSEGMPEEIGYVYTVIFTFDGFAQLTGQLWGKRKIMPNISPNKTVAGVVGGYVTGMTTGLFAAQWLDITSDAVWILPLLICTTAFAGDALASWYKRRCGLKDYSDLIPGHGGILDRYDSFMFTGAVFGLFYL